MRGTKLFFAASLVVSIILTIVIATGTIRSREMSGAAASGWGVWRSTGCEGCHTLYGQGGAFAPDLTHIYELRGANYLTEFLTNPRAFHPDQRVMPTFGLTKSQMDDLIAFLEWVGTGDVAENWPPRQILVSGGNPVLSSNDNSVSTEELPDDPAARGEYWFSRAPGNCATCHSLEPNVIVVGPSLAGIATRGATRIAGMDAETYIRDSILNPSDYVVEGFPDAMQRNLGDTLSSDQLNDIIAFLMTLE
jgi:nitric oxide reductase subunit C